MMTEKEKNRILIEEINKLLHMCHDSELIDLIYAILVNNLPVGDE